MRGALSTGGEPPRIVEADEGEEAKEALGGACVLRTSNHGLLAWFGHRLFF